MKRILRFFIFGLLAVVLAGLGTAWWLAAHGEWVKGEAEAYVTALTGRQFSIEGPLKLDLSLDPAVEARGLRLANAPWADHPDMVTIDRLAFSFKLMSVFAEQIAVNYLEADEVTLNLAENEAGEVNWHFGEEDVDAARAPAEERRWPLVTAHFEMNGFTLKHESPDRTDPLDFAVDVLEFDQADKGPVDLHASGRIGGLPLAVKGHLEPVQAIFEGGQMSWDLRSKLGEITLDLSGSVADLPTLDALNLDISFSGPEFAWITSQAALPEFSSGPFDFVLSLDSDGAYTRAKLDGDLGTMEVTASGRTTDFFKLESGDLAFEVSGPDLQALAAAFGEENLVAAPYHIKGELSVADGRTDIHEVTLAVDEDRGRVAGSVGPWPGLAGTEVDVHLQGADFSRWGPAMRIEGLEEDPFEFTGRISNRDPAVVLTTNELKVGDHRLEVAGSLGRLPDLMGAALTVDFATPDVGSIAILPGYGDLPHKAMTLKGGLGRNSSGILLNSLRLEMGDSVFILGGLIALADRMYGTELRTHTRLGSLGAWGETLGFEGLPDQPLDIMGEYRWSEGGLDFDVQKGSLGGIDFSLRGNTPALDSIEGLESQFQISMGSLQAAAFLKDGLELPDYRFNASGQVRYSGGEIGLQSIEGKLGDTEFQLDAGLRNIPELVGSQIRFSASGPALPRIIEHDLLATLPGDFAVSGSLRREAQEYQIEHVAIDLGSMHAELSGTADKLPGFSRLDVMLSATGPDISVLNKALKQELPELAFEVGGHVHGTDQAMNAEDLAGRLGASDVAGDLRISLAETTKITGKLHSKLLDLRWLIPDPRQAVEEAAEAGEPPAGKFIFTDEPIPVRSHGSPALDLDLSADQIQTHTARLEAFSLGIFQTDDVLRIDPFEVKGLFGGGIKGSYLGDRSSGTPLIDVRLKGEGVQLGIAAAKGQDHKSYPPMDIEVHLSSQGLTYRELAAGLDGQIRIVEKAGKIANAGLDLLLSDLLSELFRTLNPFAEKREYTDIDCGVLAMNVSDGVLTTIVPAVLQTSEMTIISGGRIDLGSEKLDLGFRTKLRKGIGLSAGMVVNPFIKLGGSLSSPRIQLDPTGTAVSGSIAVATAGLSLVGRALWDRFFSTRDPCGKAIEQIRELDAGS